MKRTSGFWGEVTSTRDWCENNYQVTYYIAEFWNTISNISYLLAFINVYYYKNKYKNYLSLNYSLLIYSILIVGICSALFHGTLLYWPQQFDRIFCLYPLVGASQVLLDFKREFISLILTFSHCLFSLVWLFILYEFYLAFLAIYTLYKSYSISNHHIHSKILNNHIIKAFVILLASFALNGLDLFFCDYFISTFNFVPPLHAIWHIGSGIGLHQLSFIVMYTSLYKRNLKPEFKSTKFIGLASGIITNTVLQLKFNWSKTATPGTRMDVVRDPLHHKGAVVSYSITTILITGLLTIHLIATYRSSKALHHRLRNKSTLQKKKTFLLHYITAISCGLSILCYLVISISALMAESHFPHCFCDKLPIIIPNLYVIGKIINYFFFLVRAKAAQGMMNIFPETLCGINFPSKNTMFNIVFPIILINTLLIYMIIFNAGDQVFVLWTGVCIHKPIKLGCQYLMSHDFKLLSNISPLADISLCLLFSYLFYVPILRVSKMSWKDFIKDANKEDADHDHAPTKEKFIYVLKISLILSLINIFSSTFSLSILPYFPEFWWMWSMDYILNSMCTFLMMGNDRRLLLKICCFCPFCKKYQIEQHEKRRHGDESKSDNVGSGGSSKKGSLKSMETLQVMEQIEIQNKEENLMSPPLNHANITDNEQDENE